MAAAPRIFVTGVSGYVGGHTVGALVEKHPDWNIILLVRNEAQKNLVLDRWPKLHTVIGDLDNRHLLVEEASKADVILRMYKKTASYS
jgi:nucleoside-diphosphate-sugar epimerase